MMLALKCPIACDEMQDEKMTEYDAIFCRCAEQCKAIGLMSTA
ncbi:hypothetical protein [Trichocoleus sp. FACHB-262]|nr:hypothetical protein [Trichocoleus sp. FACHB-262]